MSETKTTITATGHPELETTLNDHDIKTLMSMMSDIQELSDNRMVRGSINQIKLVIRGKLKIVQDDEFFSHFEWVNPEDKHRFCKDCGLLADGEYAECRCGGN